MKINTYIIAILFSLIFSNSDTLSVNIGKSHLYWTGQKVSGEHKGEVAIQEGYVIIKHGEILKAQIIVDMTTISVSDIESEEWNQKLVNHLKNDDFFGVDSFPTAILSIDSSKDYKSKLTPQYNSKLNGFLTIKSINNFLTTRNRIVKI